MIVIGLTGGILTGKSTVSGILAQRGAIIIDADKVGHEAYKPQTKVWQGVVDAFGSGILKENGEIDRKKLGEIVFHDPQALARLNEIMHPAMHSMMKEEIERLRSEGVDVVVLEAAILITALWADLVDEVWVTVAPEETAVRRLQDRGGLSEEQARARIRSQPSSQEMVTPPAIAINTDCTLDEVKEQVEALLERLQALKG